MSILLGVCLDVCICLQLLPVISEGTRDLSPEPTTELSESVLLISTAAWEGWHHRPPCFKRRAQVPKRAELARGHIVKEW